METISIPVRTALMPLLYKDFRCLAGACRDNCCYDGWAIAFGKKDYLKIKHTAKSETLERILSDGISRLKRHELGGEYYARFNTDGRSGCAFQTEEGLCRLQQECGAEVLPEVCREYPRKNTYTAAAREFSLSPACEAVLALLWDLPQGIDFLEEDLPKGDWTVMTLFPRLARFADIRSFCVDVLQERSLPLARRMLLLALLLQRLRERDWAEPGVVDAWLAWGESQLRSPATAVTLESLPRDRLAFLTANTRVLLGLYDNYPTAKEVYRSLFDALSAEEDWEKGGLGEFVVDANRYQALEGQLKELLGQTDEFFENLMVLAVFYKVLPNLAGPEELWRSCAAICGVYGFYWFAAVLCCHREASRERLFQVIVRVSRDLLHNAARLNALTDIVLEDGGTLERIAVLTGGGPPGTGHQKRRGAYEALTDHRHDLQKRDPLSGAVHEIPPAPAGRRALRAGDGGHRVRRRQPGDRGPIRRHPLRLPLDR